MRRGIGIALVTGTIGGAAIAGCVLFTGSTDGYNAADSGQDAAPAIPGCSSAASCSDGGEAAAEVCCFSVSGASTIGATCTPSSCALGDIQLCATTEECGGSNRACTRQSCGIGDGLSLVFSACGLLTGCDAVATNAGGTDAGATDADAGATDAGATDADAGATDADATDADAGATDAGEQGG